MSQITTPRAGQADEGSNTVAPSTEHVEIEEIEPSKTNWLYQAAHAEVPLDQIDEDHVTDADLEMYKEQQEMISTMCKMQADAFLRREAEKVEEEKREREQMQLMRIEQLELIRIQEAQKREVLLKRQAAKSPANQPASAP